MTTVPHQSDPVSAQTGEVVGNSRQDTIRSFARAYMGQGWHCLLLAVDSSGGKIPPRNCPDCDWRSPGFVRHLPETCGHLTCHGFYAATSDSDRFDKMLLSLPNGELAIRTGQASRLLVVDAEASAKPNEPSGLEVLDTWSWAAQVTWDWPTTRQARSVSGGLHLYYALPPGVEIRSGRIMPGVDVKSENGYVGAVSGVGGRSWVDDQVPIVELPEVVIAWLLGQRRLAVAGSGGGGGQVPDGYDFGKFVAKGCPGGYRDYFFNDLAFRLRMSGMGREAYDEELMAAWEKAAQPPDAEYEMPWEHVMYKAERDWATLTPSEQAVTENQRRWVGYITNTLEVTPAGSEVTQSQDGEDPPGQVPAAILGEPPAFERDLTETGNAHRFVAMYNGRMLFVSGLGWHIWNDRTWEPDQTDEALDRTQEVLLQLRREQAALAANPDAVTAFDRWYKTSSGIRAREQILKGARSDRRMVSIADQMNADPYQLVVRNGTLDLKTGEVRPSRPEDRNTQLADVMYDASATCPLWLKHVDLICRKPNGEPDPALGAYLQRWAGYTLTGLVREQKFFFGFGGGNNGKNVFIETLLGLLGTYAIRGSAQILTGSGKEHETILADLAGARMVFVDETPHGRINEARIKALTGSSKIRARKMRENSFEFDAKFKLWIAGNNKPVIGDTSKGFWRRLNLVPFDTTITEIIPGYVDVLVGEWSGILNWCLDGLKDYLAQDGLGLAPPTRVIVAGQEYQAEENVFARFIEENFDVNPPFCWSPNNVLHNAYKEWCAQEGIKNPLTMQRLANDWRQAGFTRDETTHKIKQGSQIVGWEEKVQRGWVGPRLRKVPAQLRWDKMYEVKTV